jgi:hypothetical protein
MRRKERDRQLQKKKEKRKEEIGMRSKKRKSKYFILSSTNLFPTGVITFETLRGPWHAPHVCRLHAASQPVASGGQHRPRQVLPAYTAFSLAVPFSTVRFIKILNYNKYIVDYSL